MMKPLLFAGAALIAVPALAQTSPATPSTPGTTATQGAPAPSTSATPIFHTAIIITVATIQFSIIPNTSALHSPSI